MRSVSKCILSFLVLLLISFSANSSSLSEQLLIGNEWNMARNTGLGKVHTEWQFFKGGLGEARQIITKNGNKETKVHKFTFTIEGSSLIVQEEIDEQWKGYFGVTRWKLIDGKLVGDARFRKERLIFTPTPL